MNQLTVITLPITLTICPGAGWRDIYRQVASLREEKESDCLRQDCSEAEFILGVGLSISCSILRARGLLSRS